MVPDDPLVRVGVQPRRQPGKVTRRVIEPLGGGVTDQPVRTVTLRVAVDLRPAQFVRAGQRVPVDLGDRLGVQLREARLLDCSTGS
jgi:hypothetical protein